MAKHARKSARLQAVEGPTTATVQIPCRCWARAQYRTLVLRSLYPGGPAGPRRNDGAGSRPALWGALETRPRRARGSRRHDAERVTLAGRRIRMTRARVRGQTDQELELPSFGFASHRDPQMRMSCRGLRSSGRYARSLAPCRTTSGNGRRLRARSLCVAMTTTPLPPWLTTSLRDRHFPIGLIDGVLLGDHTVLVALGVDTKARSRFWACEKATPNKAASSERRCATSSTAVGPQRARGRSPRPSARSVVRWPRSNAVRFISGATSWDTCRSVCTQA